MDQVPIAQAATPPLLPQLLAPLAKRWWLMPLMVLILWALVFNKLNRDASFWTAEIQMFAAPVAAGVAPRRGIAGLAAQAGGTLGALAGSLGGSFGSSESAPPFTFFLDGLSNPQVAAELAKDPVLMQKVFAPEWDKDAQQWREPPRGLLSTIKNGLYTVLGLPAFKWSPPDAARLQTYIDGNVQIRRSVKSPLVTLTHEHWDRDFAARFLDRLVAAADDDLRATSSARTTANINYLMARLALTPQSEAREALINALGEEERAAMLIAAELPYAAEPFAPASVGRWPTRPRPLPLLAAGLFAGILLGAALALWLDRRPLLMRWQATAPSA
jgi:hypothetical protein